MHEVGVLLLGIAWQWLYASATTFVVLISQLAPIPLLFCVIGSYRQPETSRLRIALMLLLYAALMFFLSAAAVIGINAARIHDYSVAATFVASGLGILLLRKGARPETREALLGTVGLLGVVSYAPTLPFQTATVPLAVGSAALGVCVLALKVGERLNRFPRVLVGLFIVSTLVQIQWSSDFERLPGRLPQPGRCFEVRAPDDHHLSLMGLIGCFLGTRWRSVCRD